MISKLNVQYKHIIIFILFCQYVQNIPVENSNILNRIKIPQERLGEYISYQKNAQVPIEKSLKVFHRLSPDAVIPDLIRYPGY